MRISRTTLSDWFHRGHTTAGHMSVHHAPVRLGVAVYDKACRIGGTLSLDDLAETSEIGDWKMPDFRMACSYAASQGWLIVQDDVLTLTTAGLRAA